MPVALPCVAQFVIVLDVTIVAIALPAMQADLGLSTTALGWVLTSVTRVISSLLPLAVMSETSKRSMTFAPLSPAVSRFQVCSTESGYSPVE